jgi:hypothetical protein
LSLDNGFLLRLQNLRTDRLRASAEAIIGGIVHAAGSNRKQSVFCARPVRRRPVLYHEGRRPVRRRGNMDRRVNRHPEVYHRRDGRQLRHDHAGAACVTVLRLRGKRGHRRGQCRRLRHGQHRPHPVYLPRVHAVRHDAQAVCREGLPAAVRHLLAVRLHARRQSLPVGERGHSGRIRLLHGRESAGRAARAGG